MSRKKGPLSAACSTYPSSGPKRDFATEVESRQANAAKMYPAGYTDASSYAYGHKYQYGRSPQPQSWAYYYEPENYSSPRPVTAQAEVALPEPISGSWARILGGVPRSPMQPVIFPAHSGAAIEISQPGLSPRNDLLTASGWRTIEVVGGLSVEKQEKNAEVNQEKEEEGLQRQQFESKASQTEPTSSSSKNVKDNKGALRAPAAKRKPAAAKKLPKGHAPLQQPEGDEAIRDDTAPEPPQNAAPEQSSPSRAEAEQPAGRSEPNGQGKGIGEALNKGQGEDAIANENDVVHRGPPFAGPNQQSTMDTSSKSKQTDTQEENEAAPSDEPSVDGEKEEKHLNSGNQSQSHVKNPSEDKPHGFALFSVEGSAPSVGGTLGPLTPRQQKSPGQYPPAFVRGEADAPGATCGWPVGYVPPPDDKYKELVVGSQVYLEGGTFYLSETGAYLLGLRG
ncbi:hypothetical protein, conserved [Eimeria acervulina]|uniref:Uncharacterized protein n=1 Tax=Eimeria acervulina TaxID=5801 RepID=U6GHF7_EIMAC|nr:hypothetical protein, conserved [Eimeria acervulina]CDI78723.1 hypothetical protein, conserved [Eimeria acervulina]